VTASGLGSFFFTCRSAGVPLADSCSIYCSIAVDEVLIPELNPRPVLTRNVAIPPQA